MNVTKETITPKKAMEWLKRNVGNRPRSHVTTGKYARLMKSGRWRLNGETIKFNGNGDLIDGQHRLYACIEAGVSFESYVCRGLPHEAFDTIDQCRVRSNGDVLARRGEKNYSMLAAALAIVWQINSTEQVDLGAAVGVDQISDALELHPGIRDACDFSSRNREQALMAPSIVAALLYCFRQADPQKADQFWLRVLVGESVTKDMPEFRLRSRLIDNKASAAKLRRRDLSALAIKAWNAASTGKSIKALAFFDREEFPKIHGYKYGK